MFKFYKKFRTKSVLLFLISLFLITLTFIGPAFAAENYPTYGANFERTGFVDTGIQVDLNAPIKDDLGKYWEASSFINVPGAVESSPIFVGGDMFFVTAPDFKDSDPDFLGLYSYSFYDYEIYPHKNWFIPIPRGSYSSPTYHNGFIYVGSVDGVLYCVEAETGKIAWITSDVLDYSENFGLSSSPAVMDNIVYITSFSPQGIRGVNVSDGSVLFSHTFNSGVLPMSSPSISNGIVFSPGNGGVVAISGNKVIGEYSVGDNIGTPVIFGDNIYFETEDYLYSVKKDAVINSNNEGLNWKQPRSGHVSSPAVTNEYIICTNDEGLVAYNHNGDKLWTNKKKTGSFRMSKNSPLIDGNTVYYTQNFFRNPYGDLWGFVSSVDIKTGNSISTVPLGLDTYFDNFIENEFFKEGYGCPIIYSSPVSVDGKLLIGTNSGQKHSTNLGINFYNKYGSSLNLIGKVNSKVNSLSTFNIPLVPGNYVDVPVSGEYVSVPSDSILGALDFKSKENSTFNYNISKGSVDGTYVLNDFYNFKSNETNKWVLYFNGELLNTEFLNKQVKTGDIIEFVYDTNDFIQKIRYEISTDFNIVYSKILSKEIRLMVGGSRTVPVYVTDPSHSNCTLNIDSVILKIPENDVITDISKELVGNEVVEISFKGKSKGNVTGTVQYIVDSSVITERPIEIKVFEPNSIPSDPSIEETGDDFYTSRGNFARTGVANGPGPSGPGLLWMHEFPESGYPTLADGHPVVVDDIVYASTWLSGLYPNGTSINQLNSFDAGTGELLRLYSGSGRSGLTIHDGHIYAPIADGSLRCLDLSTGEVLWSSDQISPYPWAGMTTTPVVHNGVVYISTAMKEEGYFYCLDASTGKELLKLDVGPAASWWISPSLSPGNDSYSPVVYAPGFGGVFALDTKTREIIWSFDIGARGYLNNAYVTTPVYFKEHIYFSSPGNSVYCLNAITGDLVWESDGCPSENLVVSDEYVCTSVFCLSRETGEYLWGTPIKNPSKPTASSVLAGDVLYIPGGAFDVNTGERLWYYSVPYIHPEQSWISIMEGTPAVHNGVLYYGVENNAFYAIASPKYTINYDLNVDNFRLRSGCPMNEGEPVILPYFVKNYDKSCFDKSCAVDESCIEGWYDSPNGGNRVGSPGDAFISVKNLTLYPSYKKSTNITYDLDGGSYMDREKALTQAPLPPGGTLEIAPYFPTNPPKFFAGWTDGTNTYYPGFSYEVPETDLTLKAIWADSGNKISFSYPPNVLFSQNAVMSKGSIAPGTQFELPGEDVPYIYENFVYWPIYFGNSYSRDAPPLHAEGYTFVGWDDGNKIYRGGDVYTMGNENVLFTAVWSQESLTASYDLDGGIYPGQKTVPLKEDIALNTYFYIEPYSPIKSGYIFDGWNDGISEKIYKPGERFEEVGENDIVLKAVWSPGVTITLDPQGGRINAPFLVGLEGESAPLPQSFATYKKEGVFKGWGLSPDTSFEDVLTEFTFPANDVTLYAIWEGGIDEPVEPEPTDEPEPDVYYSATFDLSGGYGGSAPVLGPIKGGTVFIIPDMPGRVKLDGFEFSGWLGDKSGKIYQPGDRCQMPYGNSVFRAIWKVSEELPPVVPDSPFRSVSFIDSDGTLIVRRLVEPGDEVPAIPQIPEKRGQLFNGWLLDGVPVPDTYAVHENIILYPDYKEFPVLSGTSDKASIVDVIILLQYVSGVGPLSDIPEEEMILIADFNDDEKLDLVDVIIFLKSV